MGLSPVDLPTHFNSFYSEQFGEAVFRDSYLPASTILASTSTIFYLHSSVFAPKTKFNFNRVRSIFIRINNKHISIIRITISIRINHGHILSIQ